MINTTTDIKIITGLSGTGVYSTIINKIEGLSNKKETVVYLSPRKLGVNSIHELYPKVTAYSLYSWIYRELNNIGCIPEKFNKPIIDKYMKENHDNSEDDETEIPDFTLLIEPFMRNFNAKYKLSFIPNNCTLFVNMYQNVNYELLPVLQLLYNTANIKCMYLCGDLYADIFHYVIKQKKAKANFESLNKWYGKESSETIICNEVKNLESFAAYNFVNEFVKNFIKPDEVYMYKNTPLSIYKQKIHCFKIKQEETDFIKQTCINFHAENEDKSICIVAYNKATIKNLLKWKLDNKYSWLDIKTIHSFYGHIYDCVVVVNFIPPVPFIKKYDKEYEKAMVMYASISQAKAKLIITTSHPIQLFDGFMMDEVELVTKYYGSDSQVITNYDVPELCDDYTLTKELFDNTMIDSLSWVIRYPELPFIPSFNHDTHLPKKHDKDKKSEAYKAILVNDVNGIVFEVKYTYRHGNLEFILRDINKLRGNGYDDSMITKYCLNFIHGYLDNRVTNDQISLFSLDLNILFAKDHPCITDAFDGRYRTDNVHVNKSSLPEEYLPSLESVTKHHKTVYFNQQTSNHQDLTLVVYDPEFKDSNQLEDGCGLLKLEVRMKDNCLRKNYVFGNVLNAEDFLTRIEDKDYLYKVFHSVLAKRRVKTKGNKKGVCKVKKSPYCDKTLDTVTTK